jgi:hypothetical protein
LLGDQRQHGGVGEMGWIGRRSEGSGMLCALRYSHWVSLEHTVGRGMWGWMRLCRKVQIRSLEGPFLHITEPCFLFHACKWQLPGFILCIARKTTELISVCISLLFIPLHHLLSYMCLFCFSDTLCYFPLFASIFKILPCFKSSLRFI